MGRGREGESKRGWRVERERGWREREGREREEEGEREWRGERVRGGERDRESEGESGSERELFQVLYEIRHSERNRLITEASVWRFSNLPPFRTS